MHWVRAPECVCERVETFARGSSAKASFTSHELNRTELNEMQDKA